ncbi:hypothetical protein G9A89_023419 [Geosiphon pyriformis]|nr:hypothetical protein G9A89_023419 [Geosiphon pyriformis]
MCVCVCGIINQKKKLLVGHHDIIFLVIKEVADSLQSFPEPKEYKDDDDDDDDDDNDDASVKKDAIKLLNARVFKKLESKVKRGSKKY